MDTSEQKLVDFLYENIFAQKQRCDYFNNMRVQSNSLWNKHTDEKKILDNLIEKYKDYYRNKIEEIKKKIQEQKEYNLNSYLTYNTEYYINRHNEQMEEINKYLTELNSKDIDFISKEKISSVSETIDNLFPNFMLSPTLLGKF